MNLNALTENERAMIITALDEHEKALLLRAKMTHNRGVKEGFTEAILDEVLRDTARAAEVKKLQRKVIGVGYYVKA